MNAMDIWDYVLRDFIVSDTVLITLSLMSELFGEIDFLRILPS